MFGINGDGNGFYAALNEVNLLFLIFILKSFNFLSGIALNL